jgi:hypothetical protein
MRERGQDEFKK